jgi:Tfp pilus assembly protein PilO
MKRTDLTILLAVVAVAALAGFWLLVLAPKREQAAQLSDQVNELHSSIQEQEQLAVAGRQARATFDTDYRRLVVLGKAVPANSDTPSLLLQVQRLADQANVQFRSIVLTASGSTDAAQVATPPPLVAPGSEGSSGSQPAAQSSSGDAATPAATDPTVPPVPATETAAAMLPLGASVGPAGLAVMPYQLKFTGGFFEIADFLQRVDAMVGAQADQVAVGGRLLTVDGFALGLPAASSTGGAAVTQAAPKLDATLSVTSYLAPASQGATAGASPAGPPSAIPAATTTPTATPATTPTATPAPTPTP